MFHRSAVILALAVASPFTSAFDTSAAQRTLKVSEAWVQATTAAETTAFATVENGTMYDVYIVAATTDAAGAVELVQLAAGKAATVKEVPIAAFDRLEMSPTGTFLKLTQLKRPMRTGDSVTIHLTTDTGERLSVDAVVK